ncbi:MAG: hypothetical protein AAGF22_12135 [Pseudomonadota bacterium]
MFRHLLCLLILLATPSLADPNNRIPLERNVEISVGQSMIVNGARGDCGARPANLDLNRTRDTKTGTLSLGKWGVKRSRTCGGWTPAIEVIFTAKRNGRETIEVNGDKINVHVK